MESELFRPLLGGQSAKCNASGRHAPLVSMPVVQRNSWNFRVHGWLVIVDPTAVRQLRMRPTKVLVAKLDHNMLGVDMKINAICCVAISLIELLSLASYSRYRSNIWCDCFCPRCFVGFSPTEEILLTQRHHLFDVRDRLLERPQPNRANYQSPNY
jgi:hypothetical protein